MTLKSDYLTRKEIAELLALAIYRQLRNFHSPQNPAHSAQHFLDVLPKEVLSVTTAVNKPREQGEPE